MNCKNSISPRTSVIVATLSILLTLALTSFAQESRKILSNPQPVYPELARRMNLEGVVKVELIVGTDGEIKDAKVLGGHPILVDTTLRALHNWKYERARTVSKIQLEIKFKQ